MARLLLPREHGTYGEILFPLVTALAIGTLDAPAILIAVAALSGYFAHEALLVVLGQRGARARETDGPRARTTLAVLLSMGAAAGLAAAIQADGPTLRSAAVPGALSSLMIVVAMAGRERTTAAEIGVALALSAWGIPVAIAGAAGWTAALACWAAWSVFFTTATLAVRTVIARSTRQNAILPRAGASVVGAGALAVFWALGLTGRLPLSAAWGISLPTALALAIAIAPVRSRYLRPIGWSFIAASVATLVGLVAAFT